MVERQQKTLKDTKRQAVSDDCNTNKSSRSLFFTYNNYTEDEKNDILKWLKDRKDMSFVFQEETGENGTQHLQGVFKSKSPILFNTLKKLFPKVHWEGTKSWQKAIEYCSKDETRTGLIYHSDDIKIKEPIENPLDGLKLYKWQKDILELIKTKADKRTINWYWENEGNIGKTSLAKYIYMKNMDTTIVAGGKGHDVRNQINNHINVEKKNVKIVLLDLVRSCEDYVSYEVIEQCKNGFMYSGKYEGGVCIFNCPHVIVFANYPPDKSKLSGS
jgi:NAD-dependent dihydropyrimidine dehydrogenase PreA subunit